MNQWRVEMRRASTAVMRGQRAQTAPMPHVPASALVGPRTLERRFLPVLVALSFVSLLVIQAWKVL